MFFHLSLNLRRQYMLTNKWASAARILKPGGSVALWTSGQICAHPAMPNAAAIQKAIDEHEERYLKPYFHPGNLLTRSCYRDLPLPWTLDPQIAGFDKNSFFRKDWGADEEFFNGSSEGNMNVFEMAFSTAR
jgi:hypothetical protein